MQGCKGRASAIPFVSFIEEDADRGREVDDEPRVMCIQVID